MTETPIDGVGPMGIPGRIRAVFEDGRRIFVELPNGNVAQINAPEPTGFTIGDAVLVNVEASSMATVPDSVVPREPWVGTVRFRDDNTVVVDVNGRATLVEANDVLVEVGNTVIGFDSTGIDRILSKDPLRRVDEPTIDDSVVEGFQPKDHSHATFADFGGLEEVKRRARELIETPLTKAGELKEIGARAVKGVLFTGLPGTGKTLLARIIANESKAAFYHVSGPEVYSKWVGETEDLLRKLFAHAGRQKRAIIFFDEIDSIASRRDSDSHESSRRSVAQLLTLMDGFQSTGNVVVIAATNRPEDIDPALLRPGRFDWEIVFPYPTLADRLDILMVTANQLSTASDLPHDEVARTTDGWSAAELAAIWSEAALLAVADDRKEIMTEDYLGGVARVAARPRRADIATAERKPQ